MSKLALVSGSQPLNSSRNPRYGPKKYGLPLPPLPPLRTRVRGETIEVFSV